MHIIHLVKIEKILVCKYFDLWKVKHPRENNSIYSGTIRPMLE